MRVVVIQEPRAIMKKDTGLHRYYAWPTIARLKDGRIVVGASGERLWHVCPFGKSVLAYSADEGETYTLPTSIIDTALDDRDTGLCAFGENGLIVTSFNNSVEFQRKYEHVSYTAYRKAYLDTITPEVQARDMGSTFRISTDGGVTFGPIYKAPITSPHGPIELQDGTILWVGRLHRGHHDYEPTTDFCEVHRIGLDGKTEFVGRLPEIYIGGEKMDACEPHMIALADGTLLCHVRVQSNKPNPDGMSATVFTIYQTISTDGGKTWSTPEMIVPMQDGAPPHLLMHSSGKLICTYGHRAGPYGIKMIYSIDNGKTWSEGQWLFDGAKSSDVGYPATIELSDGSMLTVFYAARADACAVWQMKWRLEV